MKTFCFVNLSQSDLFVVLFLLI